MNKIFIFDIDGTLTPSRQKMTKEFQTFFKEWLKKNKFYLVTGSNIEKLQEQMCFYDIEAEGIFTCCGNQFWRPDPSIVNISADLIYDNKFKLTKKLNKLLGTILSNSIYPHRYGNHIEDRGSMVNFSIVGRDCTQEQRDEYFKYDNEKGERKIIAQAIKEKFPDLDAVIGGQISIDIYPKGNDKSQILEHIKKDINIDSHTKTLADTFEYIFIGDRIEGGGNDYPLAKLMEETNNCKYFQTEGPEQTMEILQWLQIDGETK
jgi:phosphomannomutase